MFSFFRKKSPEVPVPQPKLPHLFPQMVRNYLFSEATRLDRLDRNRAIVFLGPFLSQVQPGRDGMYSAKEVLGLRLEKEAEADKSTPQPQITAASTGFPLAREWSGLGKAMNIEELPSGDRSDEVIVDAGEKLDGQGLNVSHWDPNKGSILINGREFPVDDLISVDIAFEELAPLLPGKNTQEKRAAFEQLQLKPYSDGILLRPQLVPIKAALSLKPAEKAPEIERKRVNVRALILLALLGSLAGGAYAYREHPLLQPGKDAMAKVQDKVRRAWEELKK